MMQKVFCLLMSKVVRYHVFDACISTSFRTRNIQMVGCVNVQYNNMPYHHHYHQSMVIYSVGQMNVHLHCFIPRINYSHDI